VPEWLLALAPWLGGAGLLALINVVSKWFDYQLGARKVQVHAEQVEVTEKSEARLELENALQYQHMQLEALRQAYDRQQARLGALQAEIEQVRTDCAAELAKRDAEIDRLYRRLVRHEGSA
jgi:phosphate uptake regulator